MTRPAPARPVDLKAFDEAASTPYQQNRLLFEWLCDDRRRAELCAAVNRDRGGVLRFATRAQADAAPAGAPPATAAAAAAAFAPRTAYLLTSADAVRQAFTDSETFSNAPYAAIGSGSFMLALDPDGGPAGAFRQEQLDAARDALSVAPGVVDALAAHASAAAAVMSLRANAFDAADFAEQAALRFCGALFGFAGIDHGLLERALRAGYRALDYQILARHFVTEPANGSLAAQVLGALGTRAAALIDDYQQLDPALPAGVEPIGGVVPVLQKLARHGGPLPGDARAVLVVGLLVGIVGNVQAAVCTALRHVFEQNKRDEARRLLNDDSRGAGLAPLIGEALRANPPAAFLPRRTRKPVEDWPGATTIPAGADCILVIGGAAADAAGRRGADDDFVFGMPGDGATRKGAGGGLHACVGKHLAEPLVRRVCADVLRLPSLAERLDPIDGKPIGLTKLWGFKCDSYPLQHRRDLVLRQQSLNVVMRIKSPVSANAEALKEVIRIGAPRVARVLQASRQVHFAWFEFQDDDTRLALHTVFDGDFAAYLQHFALVIGDVFDTLFRYIDDAPPTPVNRYPNEFVDSIRRFNRAPVEGFFFSAYPGTEVGHIDPGEPA